ncbi:hypothetical protein JVU11DRAFT_10837 [Chiua virens]|nr:hypothetical protein JVU11DRAFT_10837 [Chiua virens]
MSGVWIDIGATFPHSETHQEPEAPPGLSATSSSKLPSKRSQPFLLPTRPAAPLSRARFNGNLVAPAPVSAFRRALPAFGYPVPWVFDQPQGLTSSPGSALQTGASFPFRWAAPSPVYGRTTSTPSRRSFPPLLSITGVDASDPVPRPRPSFCLMPHSLDMSSLGPASILDRMSAKYGLALTIVEAVYKRLGSFQEADEVLKGMRDAAERFGQQEIARVRRVREQC